MQALTGYFTIGFLILVGAVCGHVGVLTTQHQRMLSKVALLVASPALMVMLMSRADLSHVFARSVYASYGAIAGSALLYTVLAFTVFHRDLAGRTIATLLSCYSNAGNIGIPVALYALGDATWAAPILLIQMGFMQPIGLSVLDYCKARDNGARIPVAGLLTLPFRNPLTVGCLIGLALNLLQITVPNLIATPLDMLGGMAVPSMLVALGISLRLEPRPEHNTEILESGLVVSLKCLVQPGIAYLVGWLLGLPQDSVKAVTVLAALPPAQNVHVIATRYGVRELFARDAVFRATIVSAVVILVLVTVL